MIGDVVADEFVYGRVARVSREAPVLILEYDSTEIVPGGAGNAANNVAALGGRAMLVGVVGRDEPGRRLVAALHRARRSARSRARGRRAARRSRRASSPAAFTPPSSRSCASIAAVGNRFDRRRAQGVRAARARPRRSRADAVLVSDYGSGLVTPALVSKIMRALKRKGRPIPVLIDSRYRLLDFRGLTACTPNESEVEQALGVRINDNLARARARRARRSSSARGMEAVLITRGSRGMALFVPRGADRAHSDLRLR